MKERNHIIYRHIFPNGKSYIGQAIEHKNLSIESSLNKRFGKDGYGYHTQIVYRAIQEYGWNNIKHEILQINVSNMKIDEIETKYIQQFHSLINDNGYNIENGGNAHKYVSANTRNKIASKQTWQKGINNPRYGKHCTEETKQKIINGLNEYYKYNSGFWKDKTISDDAKKKISEHAKQRFSNPKNHPRYGKQLSDDTKSKISKANSRAVLQYNLFGDYINTYKSATYASDLLNCEFSTISNACNGRLNSALNYIWFYKDEFSIDKLHNKLESFKDKRMYKKILLFQKS